MSVFVVDASVAVKWFLPEVHADAARRLLSARKELLAPDVIWAEVGNVLWKKSRRGEITSAMASDILLDFQRFPLRTYSMKSLLVPAWNLAEQFHMSVYDSLYLALAVGRDGTAVTADRRFHDALKDTPLAPSIMWVERVR